MPIRRVPLLGIYSGRDSWEHKGIRTSRCSSHPAANSNSSRNRGTKSGPTVFKSLVLRLTNFSAVCSSPTAPAGKIPWRPAPNRELGMLRSSWALGLAAAVTPLPRLFACPYRLPSPPEAVLCLLPRPAGQPAGTWHMLLAGQTSGCTYWPKDPRWKKIL